MRLDLNTCLGLCLALFAAVPVQAAEPVAISHAWARATAPGQDVGAAYMELKSTADSVLVGVTSDVTDSVEIHKMAMNKGVMEMRMLETLPLPAGKTIKLEPGGFHLMLFDLKKPLKAGTKVTLTLQIKDKQGKTSQQIVRVPVKAGKD